jgi:hypothetical protein
MLSNVFFIFILPFGYSGPDARFSPSPETGSRLPLSKLFEPKGWIGRLRQTFEFIIGPDGSVPQGFMYAKKNQANSRYQAPTVTVP